LRISGSSWPVENNLWPLLQGSKQRRLSVYLRSPIVVLDWNSLPRITSLRRTHLCRDFGILPGCSGKYWLLIQSATSAHFRFIAECSTQLTLPISTDTNNGPSGPRRHHDRTGAGDEWRCLPGPSTRSTDNLDGTPYFELWSDVKFIVRA